MAVEPSYRDETLKVEPKGIEPVRDEERHGRAFNVFTLWWGANVEFATLAVGALAVVFGLSFSQALIAIVVANVVGAALLGLLSLFGVHLGVPQMIQSRKPFGYFGNFAPGILNFIAGSMWFAVNTVLGVYALQWLTGMPFTVALLLMALIQVAIAIYGYNMIHTVERWMAIVLTAVFLVVTYYAVTEAHWNLAFSAKAAGAMGPTGAFILMFSVVFSYLLGWMAFASDYTRYLPKGTSPRKVWGNAFWSLLISCVWLEFLGLALATVKPIFGPTDLVTGVVPHAVAVITMIAVMIGTVTANVLNIYSGALSALVVNVPIKRWQSALIVGIIGTIVAFIAGSASSFLTNFQNFLFLLGYWIAPWVAVVLVDYFFVQNRHYETAVFYDRSRGFRPGFWAWLVAVILSVPFMNQAMFAGPLAKAVPGLGDITYYVSFVLAGVFCLWWGKREAAGESAGPVPAKDPVEARAR